MGGASKSSWTTVGERAVIEDNPGTDRPRRCPVGKSLVGPQINTAALKKQLAGMKSGDVDQLRQQTQGNDGQSTLQPILGKYGAQEYRQGKN